MPHSCVPSSARERDRGHCNMRSGPSVSRVSRLLRLAERSAILRGRGEEISRVWPNRILFENRDSKMYI